MNTNLSLCSAWAQYNFILKLFRQIFSGPLPRTLGILKSNIFVHAGWTIRTLDSSPLAIFKGLTALRSDEVIDLMMKEYPTKHAEYSVILQEKERQRITDHYKEYSVSKLCSMLNILLQSILINCSAMAT